MSTQIDLSALTGPELVALAGEVENAIERATFPELVVETLTDDGGTYEAVRCPVCGLLVNDSEDLYAVDVSLRWTPAEFDMDHQDVDLCGEQGDYGATLYYWHDTTPGHAVALPSDFRESWS
jgi:hypothetical protein